MIIVAASTFVSQYFPDSVKGSARLILISTVSLILSRFPFIRKLRGNNDLGLFFSLLFLTVLGLTINLKGFLSSTFYITIFCALIIIFSMGCFKDIKDKISICFISYSCCCLGRTYFCFSCWRSKMEIFDVYCNYNGNYGRCLR